MERKYRELLDFIKNRFAGAIFSVLVDAGGALVMQISEARLRDFMSYLREKPGFEMDTLVLITGVDFPEREVIELVYHLHSMKHRHHMVIKVEVDRSKRHPAVDSIHDIWRSANWMERETYDLLGVEFIGHPDLRRLLLPRDWVGHPLRKDYVEPEVYRGTPATRH